MVIIAGIESTIVIAGVDVVILVSESAGGVEKEDGFKDMHAD